MLSYRLYTVNDFHWEFKPVLSYSKPHTPKSAVRTTEPDLVHCLVSLISVSHWACTDKLVGDVLMYQHNVLHARNGCQFLYFPSQTVC